MNGCFLPGGAPTRACSFIVFLGLLLLVGCGKDHGPDLARASRLLDEGHSAEARKIAVQLSAQPPYDLDERIDLADVLRRVGEAQKAVDLLYGRELSPKGRDVLADAWLAVGNASRADAVLRRNETEGTATARTRLVRAKLDLVAQNWAGAAGHLEESLGMDDKDPETWALLGYAYQREGNPARAEDLLRRGRKRFPRSREIAIRLACVVLARRGSDATALGEAADLLRPVVARRPDDVRAVTLLARVLREKGLFTEAERMLVALVAKRGENEASWTELGIVRIKRGRVLKAVDAFRRAVDIAPRDVHALLNLGNALLRLADLGERGSVAARQAVEYFGRATRLAGSDAATWVGLARAEVKVSLHLSPGLSKAERRRQSDHLAETALLHYRRALRLVPSDFRANLGAAVLYYDLWAKEGQHVGEGLRKALKHFEAAAREVPVERWSAGPRNAFKDLRRHAGRSKE